MVGRTHTVKVSREDWIAVEDTHEGIVTREEFDRAQAAMRAFSEHDVPKKSDLLLTGKVRCGVCGYAMYHTKRKQPTFYCRTPRINAAYTCSARTPESDILDAISEGLRVQALMAVELRLLWEEQHRERKKDTASMVKSLAGLREKHQRLNQKIDGMYESFVLGEVNKTEYLASKAAAVQQRDAIAARIAEIEAALENMGRDGSLQNSFVSTFGKYMEVEEITGEIVTEVLKEIRIYPGGRFEITWNFRDELEKLMLDLQGDHYNGV